MYRFLVLLILLIPHLMTGQSLRHQLRIQLLTGTETGWWVYNKGMTDTLPSIHRGYDRTHLAFMLPFELGLIYEGTKSEAGISFTWRTLYDDVLISSAHTWRRFNKYALTSGDKQVRMIQWGLHASYKWIETPRYEFHSGLKLGGFYLLEVIAAESPFGFKWFQEILLTQKIQLSRHVSFILVPRVARMRIQLPDSPYEGARHDIYNIGFHLGLRMGLAGG